MASGQMRHVEAQRLETLLHLADWLEPVAAVIAPFEGSAVTAPQLVSPVQSILEAFGVAKDARGNARATTDGAGCYATSLPKVFAAGDMRRGQSLVVWAIREGRQCARAVDEFLMGSSELPR